MNVKRILSIGLSLLVSLSTLAMPAPIFAKGTYTARVNPTGTTCQANKNKQTTAERPAFYASFRNTSTAVIKKGENVPFNTLDVSKGDPITFETATLQFHVKKSGRYLVNYGTATTALLDIATMTSFDLVVTSQGLESVVNSTVIGSGASLILTLKEGDILQLVAQSKAMLVFGSLSTVFTDTAFISFVRL